jgi:hypothetical protein
VIYVVRLGLNSRALGVLIHLMGVSWFHGLIVLPCFHVLVLVNLKEILGLRVVKPNKSAKEAKMKNGHSTNS